MVSIYSDQRPAPRRFAASPALHAPTHLDTLVEPDWLTVPILSLLRQCLGTIGVQGAPLTHPDNEVALELLLDFLDAPTSSHSEWEPNLKLHFQCQSKCKWPGLVRPGLAWRPSSS